MQQAKASNISSSNIDLKGSSKRLPNVAILGVMPLAKQLYHSLELDHNIVGFIHMGKQEISHFHDALPAVLGDAQDLKKIIEKHSIDRVWLAVDPKDSQRFSDVVRKCKHENLAFDIPTTTGSIPNGRHLDDAIYNDSKLYERFLNNLIGDEVMPQLFWHRLLDLFISLSLFTLFLPSWLVVALAIKLESKGGVLYSQERVGRGGKIFRIYKFRSMFADAEKRSGPQLATQNDPRITNVGRILRKTRIDELPQLFNVIWGDMSLLGPRPERPYFVEKYRQSIPRYVERLRIKPGLTGHAQVESGYDESLEDVIIKLEHDLFFIEHYKSWQLYCQIFVKTIWVVFTAKGQ